MEVIKFGYNLKAKKIGYADKLTSGYGRKQVFRDNFKYFGITTQKHGTLIRWKGGKLWEKEI